MQSSQLDQLLKFLTETLQQGKDFTVDQAPKFVQELLMWRFYESLYFVVLGAALLLFGWAVAFFVGRGVARVKAASKNGYCEYAGAQWIIGLGATIVSAIVISINGYTMVQVKVAPRVVLVEMVRNLIAGQR
jgi:membrane protease YdiL (CAAX protease family)